MNATELNAALASGRPVVEISGTVHRAKTEAE
mgnify:CR=1 FL=1